MSIQMLATSQYSVIWLEISSILGAIPTYISLGLLAQRFFSWYRSSKRNMIVFLYGLGIAFLLVGNATLDSGIDRILLHDPVVKKPSGIQIQDHLSGNTSSHTFKAINDIVLELATLLLFLSYIFLWAALLFCSIDIPRDWKNLLSIGWLFFSHQLLA